MRIPENVQQLINYKTATPKMKNIHHEIGKLLAKERKKKGKQAIMKGKLIQRLINVIDAILNY